MERKLQTKIVKWLKEQGAYVVKTKPGMGTPVGCPDIFFFFTQAWGAIEVKASETARFGPGQQETLQHLRDGNPDVYVAYPENWEFIKAQLSVAFF